MAGSLANFLCGIPEPQKSNTPGDDCCRGASFRYNKCFGKLRDITNHITISIWIGKLEEFLDLKNYSMSRSPVESKAQIPLVHSSRIFPAFSLCALVWVQVSFLFGLSEKRVPWIPPLGRQKTFFSLVKIWRLIISPETSSSAAWGSWGFTLFEVLRKSRNGVWPTCWHAPWLERPAVAGRETPKWKGFCGFFVRNFLCFGGWKFWYCRFFSCLASQYVVLRDLFQKNDLKNGSWLSQKPEMLEQCLSITFEVQAKAHQTGNQGHQSWDIFS